MRFCFRSFSRMSQETQNGVPGAALVTNETLHRSSLTGLLGSLFMRLLCKSQRVVGRCF